MYKILLKSSLLVMAVFAMACKRTYSGSDAFSPQMIEADDNFAVTTPYRAYGFGGGSAAEKGTTFGTGVILGTDTLGFIFTFNQAVSYRITLEGKQSKATEVVTGTGISSTYRDLASPYWLGTSSSSRVFKDSVIYSSLEILKNGVYVNIGKDTTFSTNTSANRSEGVTTIILENFDGVSSVYPGTALGLGTPYSDLNPVEKQNFKYNYSVSNATIPGGGVEGKYAMYMEGYDYNYNSYVGGADQSTLFGTGNPSNMYTKIKVKDPDSLYINAYVYGTGTVGASFLLLVWEQDDPNFNITAQVPAKLYTDRWGVEYPVTWEGWRLVSIPYSAFKKLNVGYGNGNGKLNPENFAGISIGLDSYPTAGKKVSFYLDYLTATVGGPLKISK